MIQALEKPPLTQNVSIFLPNFSIFTRETLTHCGVDAGTSPFTITEEPLTLGIFKMYLNPMPEDKETGNAVHQLFASRQGAEFIASDFALAHLSCLLNSVKPKSVLEMGAGIGTLTYLLLTHPKRPELIVSVEDNDYCIDQFRRNLPVQMRTGHFLLSGVAAARDHAQHFDVVIFDAENQAEEACEFVGPDTIVFVEGSRKYQRAALQAHLQDRDLKCSFNRYIPGHRLIAYSKTGKARRLLWTNYRIWRRVKGCFTGLVEPLSPEPSPR